MLIPPAIREDRQLLPFGMLRPQFYTFSAGMATFQSGEQPPTARATSGGRRIEGELATERRSGQDRGTVGHRLLKPRECNFGGHSLARSHRAD